ncbi:hypothetical protein QOZ80_5AG0402850 [Eleusine coracana subsp. coracana]|nr:hypothetical protein QOZ80_5AG0402850 [Eleusine coracana subsp. coracana]
MREARPNNIRRQPFSNNLYPLCFQVCKMILISLMFPCRMFVESCQRVRLVKSSEAAKFEDALTLRLGLPGSSSDTNHKRASTSDPYLRLGPPAATPAAASSDAALILCPPPAGSDAAPVPKAPLVGWPPVRRIRLIAVARGKFVKVAVAGAPYQCRVSLEAYAGYDQLLAALQDKFTSPQFCIRKAENEETKLVDVVSGTEYVLTYEDKKGDSMLLGDVPWRMFVESCQRLRLMKNSEAVEAVNISPRACSVDTLRNLPDS